MTSLVSFIWWLDIQAHLFPGGPSTTENPSGIVRGSLYWRSWLLCHRSCVMKPVTDTTSTYQTETVCWLSTFSDAEIIILMCFRLNLHWYLQKSWKSILAERKQVDLVNSEIYQLAYHIISQFLSLLGNCEIKTFM